MLDRHRCCALAAIALLASFAHRAAAQAAPTAPAMVPAHANLTTPPLGLPPMPLPPGPAPTIAEFELGKALFAERLLSRDRTISCQSCHPPATGFASPELRPAGVAGRRALLHAPTLINRGYGARMRWDGRTASLDEFVLQPIRDPNEMDLPLDQALQRLGDDATYRERFRAVFKDGVTEANLARVLATFVRSIVAGDAPVDRFHHGDPTALTAEQRAGLWLFESKAGCWRCHPAPLFTDESFHNTGIGAVDGKALPGRAAHTGDPNDFGRFKTPTLRGIGTTAPYMHDGSLATLEDVVAFYVRGGNDNDHKDPHLVALQLDAEEQRHLIAFLRTL